MKNNHHARTGSDRSKFIVENAMKTMIILLASIAIFGPSIAGAQGRGVAVRSGFVARPGFSNGAFFPRPFVAVRPGFSHRGIFPGAMSRPRTNTIRIATKKESSAVIKKVTKPAKAGRTLKLVFGKRFSRKSAGRCDFRSGEPAGLTQQS